MIEDAVHERGDWGAEEVARAVVHNDDFLADDRGDPHALDDRANGLRLFVARDDDRKLHAGDGTVGEALAK
jgi:hypothetical protein